MDYNPPPKSHYDSETESEGAVNDDQSCEPEEQEYDLWPRLENTDDKRTQTEGTCKEEYTQTIYIKKKRY